MARVAEHLSIEELEAGFRSAKDPTLARHVQVIWLLAQGHTIGEVSTVTGFVPRWIEQLLARYNAKGPCAGRPAPAQWRRAEPGQARLLGGCAPGWPEPPPDGGLWSSGKVAGWMAGELGLAAVLPNAAGRR